MAKRILITGATGFVGANLARRLLRDGHEVHLLVRASHQTWRITAIRDDVHLHVADLSDEGQTAPVIEMIKPDWIFHLSAYGAYSYQTDSRRIIETNLYQTMNLVRAALKRGFDAFVNIGSSSEYGFKDHAPGEDERIEPNSDYAVTKAAATHYCQFMAAKHSMHMPTLRLYSVYGPFEEPSRLIPQLIVSGLRGELPPLVGPDVARDFVFVEDVCEACVLAAKTQKIEPGAIFNVGTGVQTAIREAVAIARKQLDIVTEPNWGTMPDRNWDTTCWRSDNRKICDQLGWRPQNSFEDGFAYTMQWLCEDDAMLSYYNEHMANKK